MPKIVSTHWTVQEKIFEADGFVFVRQEGSHRTALCLARSEVQLAISAGKKVLKHVAVPRHR